MTMLGERYELLEPLGSGGMARVVVALDSRLGRKVAIKILHDHLLSDESFQQRLLLEARAAAALHHPNAVAVHDVGEDDGRPFIVMELVEGSTLEQRLRERRRLDGDEVESIGVALLDVLHAAHSRGLVHRDVKPSNVLVPETGGVKLADFGIAKALDASATALTATGRLVGTPRYLAPELAAGQPATPASDLYSLGAVLYECLAGRPPFDAPNSVALALAHQSDPLPPLSEHAPQAAAHLVAVVEQALEKDPAKRFPDAAQMRTALQGDVTVEMPASAAPIGAVGASPTRTQPLDVADTAVTEPFASRPAAHDDRSPSPVAGFGAWRGWPLVALGAVVALAVVALAAGLFDREEAFDAAGPAMQEPGVLTEGEDGAAGNADPGPPDDELEGFESLDDLISETARDPRAAGERGGRLLDRLLKVRNAERDDKQAEEARKTMGEIAEWIQDGEIEPRFGRPAIVLLEPIGRPSPAPLSGVSLLFAEVALDLDAWGEKGEDLLDDLEDLLGEDSARDWAEDARDIVEEIDEWIADGELDAERGRDAQRILRPFARRGT